MATGKDQELEIFANKISLPILRACTGCQAVIFTRNETECVTIAAWTSENAIAAAEKSPQYAKVIKQIEESGLLAGDHLTKILTVYGAFYAEAFPNTLGIN